MIEIVDLLSSVLHHNNMHCNYPYSIVQKIANFIDPVISTPIYFHNHIFDTYTIHDVILPHGKLIQPKNYKKRI